MSRVVAFVDEQPCAVDVVVAADVIGELLGATVDVVHVIEPGESEGVVTARARRIVGDVIERLAAELASSDVAAGVLGVRSDELPDRPVGHVAAELMSTSTRPVLVVPPGSGAPPSAPTVLVPHDGTAATTAALAPVLTALHSSQASIVTVHVFAPDALPVLMSSEEDRRTIADEFGAIHGGDGSIELDIGVAEDRLGDVVDRLGADLVLVAWSQRLVPGRARVVQRLLDIGVRLLLVPVPHDEVGPTG